MRDPVRDAYTRAFTSSWDHFWPAYFAFTDSSVLTDQELPSVVAKFREESGEFIEDPSVDEAIDCMAILMFWAHKQGIEPRDVARRAHERLAVWEQREWKLDAITGAYHHVVTEAVGD